MVSVEDKRSAFERHMQSGIAVIILAVLAWGGNTLISVEKHQIRVSERMDSLRDQVVGLEDKVDKITADLYQGSDAIKDNQVMNGRIDRLEQRIDMLLERFSKSTELRR